VPQELRGRERQLAALEQQLVSARGGSGGALSILAEPGMGKSAMLEAATHLARPDFETFGVRGVRSERALDLAALQRLLSPLEDRIARLPEHQAEALTSVLAGRASATRLVLGTAVAALLAEAATSGPVLCWVDDVHWLDRLSLDAMAFAARRLDRVPVVMLFAAKDESAAERDRLAEIVRLPLASLDEAASRRVLLDRCPGGIADDLAVELAELAGGNPLALVELADALTPAQLTGDEPPPDSLPPDSRLRAVYRRRFFRLSPDGRRLVLLAVADDQLDGATLARAAAEGGLDLGDIETARVSRLIRVDGETVTVPSPVLRSVLYAEAPLAERRAAHDLLAHVLDDEPQRARRVWHQAALADAPDEKLGAELCTAAVEAGAAGRYADAARAWERAAAFATHRDDRATRLLSAAKDAWRGGRSRHARALLRRILPLAPDGPLRGLADRLRGEIELRDGTPAIARRMLLDAADRLIDTDRHTAIEALAHACEACCLGGDLRQYLRVAKRVASLRRRREEPELELLFAGIEGTAATYRGRHADAIQPLRRAVELAECTGDSVAKVWATIAALMLGDDLRAYELATQAVAVGHGPYGQVRPWALTFLAFAEFWLGRYDSAVEHSLEGLRLARAAGQENSAADHLALMALIAALRGDKETSLQRLAAVPEATTRRGLARPGALTVWARACLELMEDRPAAAAARIRLMAGTWHVHPLIQVMATPHFVEAAVRCDELHGALQTLEVFESWATATGNAARLALAARCRALLATDDAEADAHFREALSLHHRSPSAFELARTELMYGNLLRRARKPRAAREHLRDALQIFEYYEAEYWICSARAELRAAGEAVEDATVKKADDLTAQQLQIARLAAEGATNREIAARLVISPRTVEHHLRNIFVRLGIRSRVELPRFFR
jgi:DNA-binding CsgD family transcriptional regulator